MNKKNSNFKKIEFTLQLIILICYLLANLFYYRTFHYISFFTLFIICLKSVYFLIRGTPQMLPRELCKEWQILYPLYTIGIIYILEQILWGIDDYTGNTIYILYYIATGMDFFFPLVVVVCSLIGEFIQQKKERKHHLKKQYIHLYPSVFQWCIICLFITFAMKTDNYYSTTNLRYYEEDANKACVTQSKDGVFPDTIPIEATNVEYYYTSGGIMDSKYKHQLHLKMNVSTDYLNQLEELYNDLDGAKTKQDCSILNKYNYTEFLSFKGFDENIGEYFGKDCYVYFFYKRRVGFVIDYANCEVKFFYASGIRP